MFQHSLFLLDGEPLSMSALAPWRVLARECPWALLAGSATQQVLPHSHGPVCCSAERS